MKKRLFWWYLGTAQIIFFLVYYASEFLPEKHFSDSVLISNLASSCEFDGALQDGYKGVGLLYCPLFIAFENIFFIGWLQFLLISLLFYRVCKVSELKTAYFCVVVVFIGAFAVYFSMPSKDFLVGCSLLLSVSSSRYFKILGIIFYLIVAFLVRKQLALILIIAFSTFLILRLFHIRKARGYGVVYAAIFCFYFLGWQIFYDDGVTSIRANLTNVDNILAVDTLVTNFFTTKVFTGDFSNYVLGVGIALFPFLFFETFKLYYIPFYIFIPIFFIGATYAATRGGIFQNENSHVLIRVYIYAYILVVLGYYPDYGALVRYLIPVAPLVFMRQSYIYKGAG